ncbi:GNAT family N-acetyltransferase [Kitasatospora sp. NBC_01287]|uniref:GNAT family N-acetyltransferase n=1 Tax=Kitasatospora sp. NBC_01287 TaxID=2903573 RepID=UPI002257B132|nr:GNAT family N-acetyltransferase [Kitasatospora sp. NBC_01287]MCX4747703.1 GNAT family N-acetyltransferase [Kitasatospora sp. NBC_01287]
MTTVPQPADRPAWAVRPAAAADFADWRELFGGYGEFYRVPVTDEHAELVWGWIHDPAHEVECLVVVDGAGRPVGLAHYRPFARPLRGAVGGFLDDLFVAPHARGSGAVDALFAGLRRIAAERGWNTVRWITAEDNYRARSKYDQVATRVPFLTYDMAPGDQVG